MKSFFKMLVLSTLGLTPLAMADVRIDNPFMDPIGVGYRVCDEGGCHRSRVVLVRGYDHHYFHLTRREYVVVSHINTLEGRYSVSTYSNEPCKINMNGMSGTQGVIELSQAEKYYESRLMCSLTVTSPASPWPMH